MITRSLIPNLRPSEGPLRRKVGAIDANSSYIKIYKKGGDPSTASATDALLRLHPCHRSYLKTLAGASGTTGFPGVTGDCVLENSTEAFPSYRRISRIRRALMHFLLNLKKIF